MTTTGRGEQMARWWKLVISGGRADDLNDKDFEHIADLVKQGYTEGDLSSDEPGYETEEFA